jgi:phage-related protein
MNWGAVEAEAEVTEWLSALPGNTFGHVRFYIDLLADQGVALKEPHTRQLRGKLLELRFLVEREQIRITYFIASGRRIVLLTVFRKTKQRERAEIDRAWQAMWVCMTEHLREEMQ